VDDEPLAQNLLEKFINRLSHLTLAAKFNNAIEAIEGIANEKPDIVFLDIHMPEMTGLEFLALLPDKRPCIVMITAYPEYALEGYEYDVVDYLLKPVSFNRFIKSIQKVQGRLHMAPEAEADARKELTAPQPEAAPPAPVHKQTMPKEKFFMVKEDKRLVKVNIEDIVYVEGMKDYIKIHLADKFIVTHITMTKVEESLVGFPFMRINRSFIVNVGFIKLIEGNTIETSTGKKLPIGVNYRDYIKETLQLRTI
jgi:DNA-binding LytR/AlgR family response regulator